MTPQLTRESFLAARPFPHVVIDDMIALDQVRAINAEWPTAEEAWKAHRHGHSDKRACPYWNRFGERTWLNINVLNNQSFADWVLAKWTGIEGLRFDPELIGGGLHETFRGGFLDIHADFNIHPETRLHRRLNLLIFLNEDWREEWGGHLELWDREKAGAKRSIAPIAGRGVLFATTDHSFHGHPTPLACPPDRSRRSIALYYYSAERPASEISPDHSTLYLGDEASWPKAIA